MMPTWLSVLPPLITIAAAIWSKQILPSLLVGLLVGSYLLHPTPTGGLETAVEQIVKTLLDEGNLQVLLFLYLFSGLVELSSRAGGIKASSNLTEKHIKSERGVFFVLWAVIPFTFIDCGFRVVAAGSIVRGFADKHKVARARLAFILNNTASPVVELIPIATTYVGFNLAIIAQGLKGAGLSRDTSAYATWLRAIPFEFFSIVLLAFTLVSVFFQFRKAGGAHDGPGAVTPEGKQTMDMSRGGVCRSRSSSCPQPSPTSSAPAGAPLRCSCHSRYPLLYRHMRAFRASNVARADHSAYLRYARPYNLTAAGVAAVLFVVAGFVSHG